MKTFEGSLVASNIKVAIVAARFNEFITSKLIRRCHGRPDAATASRRPTSTWPGCPVHLRSPWWLPSWPNSGKYDAVICLGAVDPRQHQPL